MSSNRFVADGYISNMKNYVEEVIPTRGGPKLQNQLLRVFAGEKLKPSKILRNSFALI